LTKGEGAELVLGPFQGPVACTRIGLGKGVCGISWKEKRTIIVDDVDQFPGHIACSSLSKSEIVLPAFDKNGEVSLILDVDSEHLAKFDETDKLYLEQLMRLIEDLTPTLSTSSAFQAPSPKEKGSGNSFFEGEGVEHK
ncbi:MAG TPA: GAF domain-containing protein, partial [Bacteroidia bacterium]|nr:GAF domain-containing protein [Bacteroidia bacterium]